MFGVCPRSRPEMRIYFQTKSLKDQLDSPGDGPKNSDGRDVGWIFGACTVRGIVAVFLLGQQTFITAFDCLIWFELSPKLNFGHGVCWFLASQIARKCCSLRCLWASGVILSTAGPWGSCKALRTWSKPSCSAAAAPAQFLARTSTGMEAFIECVAACRVVRVLDWPQIRRVTRHRSTPLSRSSSPEGTEAEGASIETCATEGASTSAGLVPHVGLNMFEQDRLTTMRKCWR